MSSQWNAKNIDYFEVGSKTSGLNRKRAKRTVSHGPPRQHDTFLASTRLGVISLGSSSDGPCSDASALALVKVPHGCPSFGVA